MYKEQIAPLIALSTSAGACVYMCVYMYALRIVSMDRILHLINTTFFFFFILNSDANEKIGTCGVETALFGQPKCILSYSFISLCGTMATLMDSEINQD